MSSSIDNWLQKAESDLKSAKVLMERDILDTAIYHTQQAAEKAYKAFIVYKTKSFKKTHNLAVLNEICEQIDEDFNQLIELAEELTPYAERFRYPSDQLVPDKKEVKRAIEMAEQIFEFVKNKIK